MTTANKAAAPHAVDFTAWDMTTGKRRKFHVEAANKYQAEELALRIKRTYRIPTITVTPVAA